MNVNKMPSKKGDVIGRGTCPWCGTKEVAIINRADGCVVFDSDHHSHKLAQLGGCGGCYGPVMFVKIFDKREGLLRTKIYPATEDISRIPENLHGRVESSYKQALDNLSQENFEAAGMMFIKSLELAFKEKLAKNTGKDPTLNKMIEEAVEKELITKEIGEWSHQIRLIGNEAKHGEADPKKEDIEEMRDFADLVLRYLISLPKMLEKRKARAEQQKKEAAAKSELPGQSS